MDENKSGAISEREWLRGVTKIGKNLENRLNYRQFKDVLLNSQIPNIQWVVTFCCLLEYTDCNAVPKRKFSPKWTEKSFRKAFNSMSDGQDYAKEQTVMKFVEKMTSGNQDNDENENEDEKWSEIQETDEKSENSEDFVWISHEEELQQKKGFKIAPIADSGMSE